MARGVPHAGAARGPQGAATLTLVAILPNTSTADLLSRLKVDSLKEYRAIAQEKYRQYLDLYVKGVLGQPLENLSVRRGARP